MDWLEPWAFINSHCIIIGFFTPDWLLTASVYSEGSPNAQKYEDMILAHYLLVQSSLDSCMLPGSSFLSIPSFFPPIGLRHVH